MTKKPASINEAVQNRRKQLKRWIDERFAGSQNTFIQSTFDGERQVNQGELSALLKDKSFGEKRARSLELQAHMPIGYLDSQAAADEAPARTAPHAASPTPIRDGTRDAWPFKGISRGQVLALDAENLQLVEQYIRDRLAWQKRNSRRAADARAAAG